VSQAFKIVNGCPLALAPIVDLSSAGFPVTNWHRSVPV
jgi:hypothetical protein